MTNWERCVAFHGHEYGGLTIGYKAALYAIELLELEFSDDEQVVCISENDACGVDAIQVMLGCSVGKGNLLFHMRGNQLTVFDSILLGRKPYIKMNPADEDMDIAQKAMERMGLERFALRYTDSLSGGELQKVVLARALAQQPKIMLLDEPTSNLDLYNQHEVLRVVSQIAKTDGISVIVIIHDLNLALRYCDRFLLVQNGYVYRYGDESIITSEAIRDSML